MALPGGDSPLGGQSNDADGPEAQMAMVGVPGVMPGGMPCGMAAMPATMPGGIGGPGLPGMFAPGPFAAGPGMFAPGPVPAGPGVPDQPGEDGMQSELQRARFRAQFSKTEMCRYYKRGCRNGAACPYAHGDTELGDRPDLTKTSLCRKWAKNQCALSADECRFAHGASDLRVTPWYEKIALCKAFIHGRCKLGTACRFAHSTSEINNQSGATAAMMSSMAGFGPKPAGQPGDPFGGMGGLPQQPWLADPSAAGFMMPNPDLYQLQQGDGAGGLGGKVGGDGQPDFMTQYIMGAPQGMMPLIMAPGVPAGMGPCPGVGAVPAQMAPQVKDQTAKKADVQLMVKCRQGGSVKFKIKAAMPLRKLMDVFCTRKSLQREQVRFFVGGQEISQEDTAVKLGLSDDSVIEADVSEPAGNA